MPKKTASVEAMVVTITFNCGTKEEFPLSDLPDEMIPVLALHGLGQKLVDSYAGQADAGFDIAMGVWENLVKNTWTLKGEGVPRITILVRALLRIDPELIENELTVTITGMDKERKKKLEANPAVREAVAAIKAEDAETRLKNAREKAESADPIDLEELLG